MMRNKGGSIERTRIISCLVVDCGIFTHQKTFEGFSFVKREGHKRTNLLHV